MQGNHQPFENLLEHIVDNRGKTCPTAESGIPLIATNCIKNDQLYPSYEKVRYVTRETYDTWFRGHPKPGDLIFVTKGSPGQVCMAPDPVDFCIAQDMVALQVDSKKVYPKFLFALLRTDVVKKQIEQMHVGTLIPHFKKGDFDKLLLSIPDKPSQEFLGNMYFDMSAKIELNRRMNETLEAMAQAIFKSWLVDFDPVRAKAERRDPDLPKHIADLFPDSFKGSEFGEIPKGWKLTQLGEVIDIHDSKRVPLSGRQRAEKQGLYPYYGAAGVVDHIDEYIFDGTYLLVGEDGSVVNQDEAPFIQYVWGQFWVNNHAHVLTGKSPVATEHLMLFLKQTNIRPYVTGAVQLKLNQENMRRIPFILPSEKVCKIFGEIIFSLYQKFKINKDESKTLSGLRDSLLPKLISGEIKVNGAKN